MIPDEIMRKQRITRDVMINGKFAPLQTRMSDNKMGRAAWQIDNGISKRESHSPDFTCSLASLIVGIERR